MTLNLGSIGFLLTRETGGGFYSYFIHQGNKLDKERKFVKKKNQFYVYKKIKYFFLKY
jgi:hypothetical protein